MRCRQGTADEGLSASCLPAPRDWRDDILPLDEAFFEQEELPWIANESSESQ
jgi:hypothetical protein